MSASVCATNAEQANEWAVWANERADEQMAQYSACQFHSHYTQCMMLLGATNKGKVRRGTHGQRLNWKMVLNAIVRWVRPLRVWNFFCHRSDISYSAYWVHLCVRLCVCAIMCVFVYGHVCIPPCICVRHSSSTHFESQSRCMMQNAAALLT